MIETGKLIENGTNFQNGNGLYNNNKELRDTLYQIKKYLEKNIQDLTIAADNKDREISELKSALQKSNNQAEGNTQLINKLLNDLSKLQNDIEWYKLTYEKRSFLGTMREKLFRKH